MFDAAQGCSAVKLNVSPATNDGASPPVNSMSRPASKLIGPSGISKGPFHAPESLRHWKCPPSTLKTNVSPCANGMPPGTRSNESPAVALYELSSVVSYTNGGNGPSTSPVTYQVSRSFPSCPPTRYKSCAPMIGSVSTSPTWYVAPQPASPIVNTISSSTINFSGHLILIWKPNSFVAKYLPSSSACRDE